MGFIQRLFGYGEPVDYRAKIAKGVKVIDVRTTGEYKSGHLKKSVNLPLQDIARWKSKFQEGDEVILVCKSGARAGMARRKLKQKGVVAYNAGAWQNLS